MSIQSEISRISGNVSDALDAIEDKGVTIPSGANSDDLADLIAQITGGGIDGNNIGYGITDNSLPKIGIGQIEYAHVWDENGQEMIFGSGLVGTGRVV